ncbi:uncharacterized protein LOC117642737 isoform X2 [Thrips palmi]|uniref:Uncharacterized protein LOC117642737 isoform X2 n=1 Tax=Thrips palmi TaxID=161013 RepID=A0A6P8ZKH6_THRPL|nr:uncharacterized protein LOC117642737 isoform X2 [Thrips palmi]
MGLKMGVFTVRGRAAHPKVLIAKSTLSDLTTAAALKLKLPTATYQVFLERNGALIDEDELLSALGEADLVVLPEGEDFASLSAPAVHLNPLSPLTPTQHHSPNTSQSAFSHSTPNMRQSGSLISSSITSFPWSAVQDMERKLQSGTANVTKDRKLLIHELAAYMDSKKDYTRGTCSFLTKELYSRFSDAFPIVDADGVKLSSGKVEFLASLYERVNFVKPKQLKEKKRKRSLEKENDEEDFFLRTYSHQKNEKFDSYGCVAWQPTLSYEESEEDQENMRKELIELNETDTYSARVGPLMEKSYFLQRSHINNRTAELKPVLKLWPFLYTPCFLLKHADMLLGKDVRSVFERTVETRGILIYRLMKSHVVTKTTKRLVEMKALIDKAEEAGSNLRSNVPFTLAAFVLVILHFQEDMDSVLRVVDPGTSQADLEAIDSDRPILIVKGRSLFDESATAQILCENSILIRESSAAKGFLYLIICYYAYNYNYASEAQGFLEFLQRFYLKINPESGHKRGPKAKKGTVVHPKVRKLICQIALTASATENSIVS